MKTLTAAVVVTLASVISACGGADIGTTGTQPPSIAQSPSDETSSPVGSDGKSRQSPSDEASYPAGRDGEQVLVGTVGEAEDPEAFTIQLTNSSGEPVTTLAAGEYQVKVTDPATLHNFHLTGPGVDESTSVSGTGEVTWTVTLKQGSYTFICDPHPEMVGDVTVT